MTYVLIALPVLALIASVIFAIKSVKKGKKTRNAVAMQLLSFMAVAIVTLAVPLVASAAEEGGHETTASESSNDGRWAGFLAAGAVTGISGIGGGMAVAAAAPAAIGATSEDPKAFGKALIFVALGEGVALYGLLISILILNKV